MNDFIYYKLGEKTAKVPVDKQSEFESKAPTAQILYTYKGKNVGVPLDVRDEFISKAGAENLTYSYYDDNNEYSLDLSTRKILGDSETVKDSKPTIKESGTHEDASAKDDKTSIFETIGKGVGAAGVGTAKLALDLGRAAWNTSVIGGAANKIKQWMNPEYGSMDERLRDESNPLTRASMNLGELQERLSREADPTGGQMGFGELLKEGKVGMALQKALGSGLESLPMMVAAGTGVGSLVYGAALAAGTYADETRDNPEIPAWKRGINSIGSAALEMAVEKIGGPLKNLGGKAAKEITEETATEILKNFAKEGTETVSKRIFNTLKNIGKEGLEEGGEELLTSFGNDALGEALDLIDGDKDYGIRAQWEQMKERDPNADLGDFAKSKAKEYFDAFLGGALSGMEISGTVQGINAAATPKNDMQRRYDLGASLDYQDMYDADEVVKKSADIAAKSFEDKDGKSSISREFLDGLSADETYNLSRSDEFSNKQRAALRNLAGAKAMQNGLNDKLDKRLEDVINAARTRIEKASNEDGSVVVGMYGGRSVYVKGAVANNGIVTLPNGKDGPMIIVDTETGEETTANSNEISSAMPDAASNALSIIENGIRLAEQERRNTARNTMSLKAKYNAIKPYVGKKIMVDLGNGIIEVGVQQILPESGEVLVKGKKGDLGGNAIEKIGIGAFYDSIARDDAGNPMFAEGEIETEVEPEGTNVETPQEAEVTEEDDFRDTVAPILINGVPVEVEVVSQDNATNRIVYRYTDENGQERTGTASIGEFKTALQQAQEYKPEEPIAPEVPTEPTVEATTEPSPAPTDVPTEIEPVAEEINWDALFEQDPEAYFSELNNQFGEEATDILNEEIEAAQEELDSLTKKRGKTQNERLANRKKKAALQNRIEVLNGMVARLTHTVEQTTETPAEQTAETVAETDVEPINEPIAAPPTEEAETSEATVEPTKTESITETAETPVEEEVAPTTDEASVQNEPIEEAPATETEQTTTEPQTEEVVEQPPVAPNPVKNPIREAQKREKSLATQLKRVGISPEQKQDMAFNAGKAVGDFFATREEYDAYAENATDLGDYNADFERGVEESFAKRQQNISNSPVNSVPLEGQSKEGENESERDTQEEELREGYNGGNGSTPSDDEGRKEGASQTEAVRGSETDQSEVTEDKYPVRNGDATPQLLIDTFGFESISPNVGQSNLNTVYDFMMEMSKMLGISPKSIGHGATLGVGILNDNARPAAQYSFRQRLDGTILEPTLRFKNTALSSIAHEWWHSLDQALSYYETGKGVRSATNAITTEFTGRPETLQAVRDVVAAINKSGHKDRLKRELSWDPRYLKYSLRKDEMSARAFEEYLKMKFAEVGIDVQGFSKVKSNTPTAEEMAVIAPAFDNLFSVLKEKPGRKPDSSILYRKGETIEEANERFNKQLTEYLNNGPENMVLVLGNPHGAMEMFLPRLPIVMRPRIINKASETKHNVDPNALMDLPQMISEPIFVFRRNNDTIGILTEILDRDGKNVCVAIELNKTIQDGSNMLEVNDIRSIHGREVANIVLPIVYNETLAYTDKTKGLNWLSSASYNYQQEIDQKDLDAAANIVKEFENPTVDYDTSARTAAQNASVDYLVGVQRSRAIERAVSKEAKKLGVNVTYKTREEMPNGHKNDKGYYNTKTGEIVVCTENNASINDAIQTILHEAVAHKGLRQLMGDRFDEFISRVYDALDAETKAKVDELAAKHYNGKKAVAMEEYMATLAESENFAETSAWDKIKDIFEKIINSILGRNDIKIGDNELRYILRASYANMVNPRNMETIEGWAKDTNMREEYKINEATPEILSRTGIDPTEAASETAKQVYGRVIQDNWNEFQRQFQDDKQPVRIAIDAIQQETGNVPIEDYENYILISNQASSRSRVEIDKFARKYYSPIIDKTNRIIDKILEKRGFNIKDEAKRAEVYAEIRQYLIAKHGLERNAYYQATKTKIVDGEEVPDIRDYSGLTALFGMDKEQFKEAEAEAERVVESFEAEMGDMTTELWKKINAATNKTLRHSYECGMISRQQYNEIKGMFQYYIPLRGFDETTAEDVYSYARFEGNRFNPAVVKTGGRTSLADDPLAIIMNMAESEIAQGNKNRAKQALYNYILNRPIVDADGNQRQNTLMQIEDVWYMKDADGTYSIAAPNHEIGETYEEFENKMQALAEKDMAKKSKRGHVDVGMRFQKRTNENAHYIYLKVNGVEKAIYINGDPKAAEAVNGSYKAKPMYGEGKMRDINRLLSSTFTNYSLEFTARNYFRDMIYSHINIGVRESDPAYRKKFRQNWRHNNLPTMMKMLKAYRAGEFEGRLLTEDEAAFVEFMENGGQTGYTLINSVENHKKDLERAIKNMQNGIEKGGIKDSTAFKYTLGAIETLNEASELVTRFAAFKTSRDMGRGIETSINDAKEITVNFNTKGAQDGRGWMGMMAKYFGWSKFFFNASVQGVQNVKAMASANKTKFGTVVGGIVATGFFMPLITAAISELFGGDDEEEYWNIPEYDRQNNLCIVVGDSYAKIPLPIGFREIYAIGDMVAAMVFDKKFTRDFTQVGTDIANKLASVILPINPLESAANGLSIWHTAFYAGLPSSLQFAIQNMTNIDWKGAPLQKEYTYNENDPQWMKAYASNPDWMVSLSKWCNEHINADGDFDGWDWSPEKLDNTLSNLLGGIYSLIKKSGRSISMIWNEENRNLSNIPLTVVVMGSNLDKDDSFVNNAYYDMKEYYDENIGTIERTAKAFGLSLKDVFEGDKIGAHHPKMQQIYSNRNFDWMQEWYLGDKELKSIRDKIKRREKKMNASENPSHELLEEIATLNGAYNTERRDFVNDMLELD